MSSLFSFFSLGNAPPSETPVPAITIPSDSIASRRYLSAAQTVMDVRGRRHARSTQSNYGTKIKKIARVLKSFAPHTVDEQDRIVPERVTYDNLRILFGLLINPHTENQSVNEEKEDEFDIVNGRVAMKFETLRGYKSALKDYYKTRGAQIPEENLLEEFLQGFQRLCAEKKLNGTMQVYEGKQHLPFSGYRLLAEKLVSSAAKERSSASFFGWAFLVLQWNLMARSHTVATIVLQHIKWEEDSLIVTTPMHKGDPGGDRVMSRHVFANPLDPLICPILALAVFVFCKSIRMQDRNANFKLFEGDDQEGRFSKLLQKILSNLTQAEELKIGCNQKDIGTHSARKGAPSYCLSMPDGPQPVPVYLRAGWSIGKVQDCYLFLGKGADQLTGRTVSGLPMTDLSFATLPPHFSDEVLSGLTQSEWNCILPGYSEFPQCFRQTIPYLLATIVKHETFLLDKLGESHAFFHCSLFTSRIIQRFRDRVLTGEGECTVTKLKATGVPSSLAQTAQYNEMRKELKSMKESLMAVTEELPMKLKEQILNNFVVNGAIPITMEGVKDLIGELLAKIRGEIRESESNLLHEVKSNHETMTVVNNHNESEFRWHQRADGRFYRCPSPFIIPKCGLRELWVFWWCGRADKRIGPLRRFDSKDMEDKTAHVSWHCKTKKVFNELKKIAESSNGLLSETERVEALSEERSAQLFDQVFKVLTKPEGKLYQKKYSRTGELSIGTIYYTFFPTQKHQVNPRKRKRQENNEQQEERTEQVID
jgi:hypothetical protein